MEHCVIVQFLSPPNDVILLDFKIGRSDDEEEKNLIKCEDADEDVPGIV